MVILWRPNFHRIFMADHFFPFWPVSHRYQKQMTAREQDIPSIPARYMVLSSAISFYTGPFTWPKHHNYINHCRSFDFPNPFDLFMLKQPPPRAHFHHIPGTSFAYRPWKDSTKSPKFNIPVIVKRLVRQTICTAAKIDPLQGRMTALQSEQTPSDSTRKDPQ